MLLHSDTWEGGANLLGMSQHMVAVVCRFPCSSQIEPFPWTLIFRILHMFVCALHGREVQQVALLHVEAIPDDLLVKTFFTIDIAHCVVLIHSLYTSFNVRKSIRPEWQNQLPYYYEPDVPYLRCFCGWLGSIILLIDFQSGCRNLS